MELKRIFASHNAPDVAAGQECECKDCQAYLASLPKAPAPLAEAQARIAELESANAELTATNAKLAADLKAALTSGTQGA